MRQSLLLLGILVACNASPSKRVCGDDPDDCVLTLFHLNSCTNVENATEQKGIKLDLLDKFRFFSQFAAAAYWPNNNNSTGDLVKCSGDSCPKIPTGNCPDVEKSQYTTVIEWKDAAKFDDHGFVAISRSDKLIVLAFRGSNSPQNEAEDLKIDFVNVPEFCECCKVHHGFWESWRGISKSIIQLLVKLHDENPDYRVAITGHSLGGAEATLAAGEIWNLGAWWTDNVELYTYGSPRIGNTQTVRFLSQQSSKSYRVTAMQDPVPRVPPTSLRYQHTSPEYWIHSNPDDPGPEDVNVLSGYYNPKGVDQFGIGNDGWNDEYHRHYFGYIAGCDSDPPEDPSAGDMGR